MTHVTRSWRAKLTLQQLQSRTRSLASPSGVSTSGVEMYIGRGLNGHNSLCFFFFSFAFI